MSIHSSVQTHTTLGQELRRMRSRKGVSQFDLAVRMGWKGTNPILLIEKDRRIPKPATLEKLGCCLGLSPVDIHYLNGLAGHVLPTRFPNQAYVIDTLEKIAGVNHTVGYPVLIVDYQFRLWLANPAAEALMLDDLTIFPQLLTGEQGLLDIIFDTRLGICTRIDHLNCVQREYMFRFKSSNAMRQHEDFFMALPARMQTLEQEDWTAFQQIWELIDLNTYYSVRCVHSSDFYYTNLQQGDIRFEFPAGQLAFYTKFEPVLHLNSLFQIVSFIPVVPHNDPHLPGRIIAQYQQADTLKRWELAEFPFD